MGKAGVYNNGRLAGILEKRNAESYVFTYADEYYRDQQMPAISLGFPKTQQQYEAKQLFT